MHKRLDERREKQIKDAVFAEVDAKSFYRDQEDLNSQALKGS